MIKVELPDGSERRYVKAVTVLDVAQDISPSLAKQALAAKINGQCVDLSYPLPQESQLIILTEKDKESLDVIRHSTAHLLAQAVKELFPTAQVTIGPVIEDGFYYDFAYDKPFTPEDLTLIEKKMGEITKRNLPIHRKIMPRDEAIKFFNQLGEHYKAEIIHDLPANETISVYEQGDFVDLCRGPHVPNTNRLKVFKLMKVAGAYWRGDANNAMLQRIYGTAWVKKEDLEAYLFRLSEAEKRDHRKIGKALHLFHTQEEAPGMIFWHPNGWTVYRILEEYVRDKLKHHGYQEIRTPQIIDRSLWEKSGHWEKFKEEMFTTESEKRDYAIKPMSCPAHIQVFNQGLRSYRDLPLRFAEFGCCHRNEPSGALHGLLRVRGFTQDDAHIFCTEDQVQQETSDFIDLALSIYADFDFKDITLKLATRPPKRVGADETWDKAEHALQEALNKKGLNWELAPGDGAFYGPKIEFSMKDCLGRVWTCGSIQLDFSMPERLGAHYIAEDNSRRMPIMLHRAILGSLERFMGIILEHYAGHLPPWLAPTQVVALNITEAQGGYIQEIVQNLKNLGFRAKFDLRNEKIGFKIREHTLLRVPYLLIVGDRELADKTVSVRTQSGKDLGSMSISTFSDLLLTDIKKRGRAN